MTVREKIKSWFFCIKVCYCILRNKKIARIPYLKDVSTHALRKKTTLRRPFELSRSSFFRIRLKIACIMKPCIVLKQSLKHWIHRFVLDAFVRTFLDLFKRCRFVMKVAVFGAVGSKHWDRQVRTIWKWICDAT